MRSVCCRVSAATSNTQLARTRATLSCWLRDHCLFSASSACRCMWVSDKFAHSDKFTKASLRLGRHWCVRSSFCVDSACVFKVASIEWRIVCGSYIPNVYIHFIFIRTRTSSSCPAPTRFMILLLAFFVPTVLTYYIALCQPVILIITRVVLHNCIQTYDTVRVCVCVCIHIYCVMYIHTFRPYGLSCKNLHTYLGPYFSLCIQLWRIGCDMLCLA